MKTEKIDLRVTKEQKERIKEDAESSQLSISAYILFKLLGKK